MVQTGNYRRPKAHNLGRIPTEMRRNMTSKNFRQVRPGLSAEEQNSLTEATTAAAKYAENPNGWLTLFGNTGVGKTHLAVAIANTQMDIGNSVFFAFVPELLDYLRAAFAPNSRLRYDSLFDEVKNAPLLILDGYGQEYSSPWANDKLYQIIVHRHNHRLPTIITSLLDLKDNEHNDSPSVSRMRDSSVGKLVRIDAPNYWSKE